MAYFLQLYRVLWKFADFCQSVDIARHGPRLTLKSFYQQVGWGTWLRHCRLSGLCIVCKVGKLCKLCKVCKVCRVCKVCKVCRLPRTRESPHHLLTDQLALTPLVVRRLVDTISINMKWWVTPIEYHCKANKVHPLPFDFLIEFAHCWKMKVSICQHIFFESSRGAHFILLPRLVIIVIIFLIIDKTKVFVI